MKIKCLLAAGATLCALVAPSTAMASGPALAHITGKVEKDLVAHLDKSQVTDTQLATLRKIAASDKNFKLFVNLNGSVDVIRVYPALQGTVLVNGTPVQVDKDGNYSADVTAGTVSVEMNVKGKTLNSRSVNLSGSLGANIDLKESYSFSDYFGNMDAMNSQMAKNSKSDSMSGMSGMSTTSTGGAMNPNTVINEGGGPYPGQSIGEAVSVGEHVHCNRFNGPNSDDHYWSQGSTQAVIDFAGSDCDDNNFSYGCQEPYDTACNGLGSNPVGILYDCSNQQNWPITFWRRN